MRVRALLAASAIGLSLLVAPVEAASAAAPVHAAVHQAAVVHKACTASVSVLHPKAGGTTVVRIAKIGAGLKVKVVAHYKSKPSQPKNAVTSTKAGTASAPFSVGRPTKGYKVVVDVTASKGNTTWACSTYFVPA